MTYDTLQLTPQERKRASLLFVETERAEHDVLRQVIRELGLGGTTFVSSHFEGYEAFDSKKFTHVIFPAAPSNMPPTEFVQKLLAIDPTLVLIPCSWQPKADDVFRLLQMGCRGYLCKPFTYETIDSALIQATKGEPIAQAILDAKDRNEAFAAMLAGCIDRLATVQRQARLFDTAKKEVASVQLKLAQAGTIAKTFARGSEDDLRDAIVSFLTSLAEGPATRLGRLRKRLSTKRLDETSELGTNE